MYDDNDQPSSKRTTRFGKPLILAIALLAAIGMAGLPTAAAAPVQEAKLTADDGGSFEFFGQAVAVDGDTALVGSSDSAYVFTRNGTAWTQQAQLNATDDVEGDRFGYAVAVDGDTALVGAPQDDDNGTSSGSVYVFTRNGTDWTQQTKLNASDAAEDDRFGEAVALDGDTALVGAMGDSAGAGSAYVFTRTGTVWSQQAKVVASDGVADDEFGTSVALVGDTALVGAPFKDDSGSASGSAYVFTRTGTVWSQHAKLIASDAAANDEFGQAVAVDGDTAVVGAPQDDDAGLSSGSAYVFNRSSTTWSQQGKLNASDADPADQFGTSVALEGDTAVLGAPFDEDNTTRSGLAYVFTRNGTDWTQQAKLNADDADPGDEFGLTAALDGDTAVLGAPSDEDEATAAGSAYVFDLVPDIQGPITSDVGFDPDPVTVGNTTTVTAHVNDSTTGGSTIASAEYSVNGSAWEPLNASDGAYDEVGENVTGTIGPFAEAGSYEICVRGTDAANNTGAPDCATLTVSEPGDEQRPPSCPEGLQAEAHGNEDVTLSWNASTSADNYHVYRATGDGPFEHVANVTATSYTDNTTEAETTYTYEVTAANEAGEAEGCPTAEVTAVPFFGTTAIIALAVLGTVGIGAVLWARRS